MSVQVLDTIARMTPEQQEDLLARCTPEQAVTVLGAVQAELRDRCARDGFYWLRFVQTRDEADSEHAVKPFPIHEPYVEPIWRVLERSPRVIIAKSRQMLMSWILCAFCAWWARFKAHQSVYFQTQKAEDAYEKVALPVGSNTGGYMGRCQFIEAHLPAWLQVPVRPTQGQLAYPNGSVVIALPGGADQIRGKVASLIVQDEFAFQPEAHGVYTACVPLIQKQAKFIACSTPNGSQNEFARLWLGEMR